MDRYEPGHGKGGEYMGMEEDSEGHWCAYEDVAPLQDEVARLRERVAELKRELVEQELRHVRTREERAALSSARRLLENVNQGSDWYRCRDEWLRAHPEPATPAATGAEPREPLHRRRIGAAELQQRAEKERGT